jgi:hypothetical protein
VSDEACKWCDRDGCGANKVEHAAWCLNDSRAPVSKAHACPGCAAKCDCAEHAHNWRSEALRLRACLSAAMLVVEAAQAWKEWPHPGWNETNALRSAVTAWESQQKGESDE